MLLHDVRTPLATLGLALEALTPSRETGGREERRAHALATTRFERVRRLLEEMELVLSGDDAPVRPEPIELDSLLADVLEDVRRAYPEPLFAVRGVLGARVRADELGLRRVFTNLVHNAARHARSRVWVEIDRDSPHAIVRVCDDGDGLQGLDAVEAFRADRCGEGSKGSGLGLAIVRMVLAQLGAEARVVPGAHTTFEVRLPGLNCRGGG